MCLRFWLHPPCNQHPSTQAEWSENPFASGGAKSGSSGASAPFDDPSITQAAASVPEYNPFEGGGAGKPAASAPEASNTVPDWANPSTAVAAAVVKPAAAEAAAPTWSATTVEPTFDQNLDEQSLVSTPKGDRDKNWPPFPENCRWPCRPCFHHDFRGEIPEWGYPTLKNVYRSWVFYCINLLFNCISAWAALDAAKCTAADAGFSSGLKKSAWLAPLLMLIFVPCSYCCWFQPLYQAMRKDSSLRFGWYFLTFFLQVISTFCFATGFFVPASGFLRGSKMVKLCNAADEGSSADVLAILFYINGAMWTTLALYQLKLLYTVLRLFRSSGGSLEKMQNEAVTGAVTSDVGKQAGKAAFSNAMSNA